MVLALERPAAQSPSGVVRDAFVDIPGVRLFYRDSGGGGVPMVFLHAATADSRGWEHQTAVFTAAGYRFIAFDRRGSGQSVIDENEPQPGTAVDDLVALLDHLKIDRVHLVGTGAGGLAALDALLSVSPRLRSVVFACAQGGVQDQQFQDVLARLRSPGLGELSVDFRELGPSYRAANPEGRQRWLENVRAALGPSMRLNEPPLRNRITFALLETIKTPLLFIAGGADPYAPPALMRLLAARVKHSEFVVVPEAGHSAYWEQPELFNDAVLRFIRKH
jgi:pimeloyl-ACP methyl ester carboxylesterase